MVKKVRVTKVEEESRREQFQRGIKKGSMSSGMDKGIAQIAEPLSAPMKHFLKKLKVEGGLSDKAVDSFVHACIGMGVAEVASSASVVTEKIPGLKKIDKEKTEQIGRLLRGYVGEKMGSDGADGVFAAAPVFASLISSSVLGDLLSAAEDIAPVAQLTEGEKFETIPETGGKNGKNNSR